MCRENILELLSMIEQYIEEYQKIEQRESVVCYFQRQKEIYTKFLKNAPARSEVNREVGDYSENIYGGTRDGKEYHVEFAADKEYKRSFVRVMPMDSGLFAPENADGYYRVIFGEGLVPQGNNRCAMTMEEAEKKACTILEELGLTGFTVHSRGALAWELLGVDGKQVGSVRDGYSFWFTRNIGGLRAENPFEVRSMTKNAEILYDPECCVVELNDTGLTKFYYTGIMEEVDMPAPVKLLSLENLKETVLNAMNQEYTGRLLQSGTFLLCYIRMREETDGEYRILPAWVCVPRYYNDMRKSNADISSLWCFNAVDGELINLSDVGFFVYNEEDFYRTNFYYSEFFYY